MGAGEGKEKRSSKHGVENWAKRLLLSSYGHEEIGGIGGNKKGRGSITEKSIRFGKEGRWSHKTPTRVELVRAVNIWKEKRRGEIERGKGAKRGSESGWDLLQRRSLVTGEKRTQKTYKKSEKIYRAALDR